MVLKLYGHLKSPWVRLVAVILHEKEVEYELVPVNLADGEHKKPEYLAKHPFGQIPSIDDDGFILYESKAISYYIASKYADQGTPLLPTGIQDNARFQQAVFAGVSHFDLHGAAAAREVLGKQRQGLTPDKEVFDKHIADLSKKLDVYEKILLKQKFLLGDGISLVDLYHLPVGYLIGRTGSKVLQDESRPNVVKWYKDITSRESWLTTDPEPPTY